MVWKYTRENPCKPCYGWDPTRSSSWSQEVFCPECERKHCFLHWPYQMQTEEEAIHFLKSAEFRKGKKCFVKRVNIGRFDKLILASKEDYQSYVENRKHRR